MNPYDNNYQQQYQQGYQQQGYQQQGYQQQGYGQQQQGYQQQGYGQQVPQIITSQADYQQYPQQGYGQPVIQENSYTYQEYNGSDPNSKGIPTQYMAKIGQTAVQYGVPIAMQAAPVIANNVLPGSGVLISAATPMITGMVQERYSSTGNQQHHQQTYQQTYQQYPQPQSNQNVNLVDLFKLADQNGDGRLDANEYQILMQLQQSLNSGSNPYSNPRSPHSPNLMQNPHSQQQHRPSSPFNDQMFMGTIEGLLSRLKGKNAGNPNNANFNIFESFVRQAAGNVIKNRYKP